MDESRERFAESMEMISQGLTEGYCEYDGQFVKQPRREIRPAPFKDFAHRTYAATMSPDSLPILARLKLAILIIPQKPWAQVEKDFAVYNSAFREANGEDAPPPLAGSFVFVDRDAGRAKDLAYKHIGAYYHTVMKHYEFARGHLKDMKSYAFYDKIAKHVEKTGSDNAAAEFVELMPYGTPDQVLEKIRFIHARTHCSGLLSTFSYGGMPQDEAQRNLSLFSEAVLPELKRWKVTDPAFAQSA